MPHALGISVVAEGVEEKFQLDTLSRRDCDQIQGFLLARPMTAESVFLLMNRE